MNVVVFGPHPDDTEVSMGGTIAQYTQKGHDVSIVLVSIPNDKETRREESKKSAAILGAHLSVLDLNPYELILIKAVLAHHSQAQNFSDLWNRKYTHQAAIERYRSILASLR